MEKEAVLAISAPGFFTIPHFDGYSAVLIRLETVRKKGLRDALVDGWLACAPSHLADEYLKGTSSPSRTTERVQGTRRAGSSW